MAVRQQCYALLILTVLSSFVYADLNATGSGGLSATVLGQSGKMTITNTSAANPAPVTVSFVSIEELDANEGKISTTGHFFKSFATQDFTFSPLNTKSNFEGINATHFSFSATLVAPGAAGPNAAFVTDIYLIQSKGTIANGNQSVSVESGDFKFNVALSNWNFCNPCTGNKYGSHVMLTIDVVSSTDIPQSNLSSSPNSTEAASLTLGGGASIKIPSMALVDGLWAAAPVSVSATGNVMRFTVSLPKFSNRVIYDPVLALDASSTTDDGTPTSSAETLRAALSMMTLSMSLVFYLLY